MFMNGLGGKSYIIIFTFLVLEQMIKWDAKGTMQKQYNYNSIKGEAVQVKNN